MANTHKTFICTPIAQVNDHADWMQTNLGANSVPDGENWPQWAPGDGWPGTHSVSAGVYDYADTTTICVYFLGLASIALDAGWANMDAAAQVAFINSKKADILAATDTVFVIAPIASSISYRAEASAIDTGGDPLGPATPPEE